MVLFVITIAIIVAVYAGFSLYLMLNQHRMVYNPERRLVGTPADKGLPYEEVTLRTDDNVELHAWYIPAANARRTVLFFHGNAGNISHRFETLDLLHEMGFNTLIFDYRGYGKSGGAPSEQGTYHDALAAWSCLVNERNTSPHDIILFGRSLGGGIASWLAARENPLALIIESSFTSIPDLAQRVYPYVPISWLARIRYDTRSRLDKVNCPVLIVHSRDDELIPFAHGKALYESLRGHKKAMLEIRGRHADGFLLSGTLYTSGIRDFLAGL
jgi:fermentation-respiration switch protein FrsA (DUF1100 family)